MLKAGGCEGSGAGNTVRHAVERRAEAMQEGCGRRRLAGKHHKVPTTIHCVQRGTGRLKCRGAVPQKQLQVSGMLLQRALMPRTKRSAPWACPHTGISSCLRKLGAASAAQDWEAAAPAPPPNPAAGSVDTASATAASRAACDHVNRGLAVLEQRAAAIVSVQGTMVGRAPPTSGPLSAAARSSGSFSRPSSAIHPAAAQATGSATSSVPPPPRPSSGASTASQPQSQSQPQRPSYRESTASYGVADSRRPSSAQTGVSVLDAVAAAAGVMDRKYEVILSDEEGEVGACTGVQRFPGGGLLAPR